MRIKHSKAVYRLHSEYDIFGNRIIMHKLKVLVNHAYTQSGCRIRILYLNFFSAYFDYTLIRFIRAEKYRHKSRFSGPVFAQQSQNFVFADFNRYIIVCNDARKGFCDADHLYRIIFHFFFRLPIKQEEPENAFSNSSKIQLFVNLRLRLVVFCAQTGRSKSFCQSFFINSDNFDFSGNNINFHRIYFFYNVSLQFFIRRRIIDTVSCQIKPIDAAFETHQYRL